MSSESDEKKLCIEQDCGEPLHEDSKFWCERHFLQWKRSKEPVTLRPAAFYEISSDE